MEYQRCWATITIMSVTEFRDQLIHYDKIERQMRTQVRDEGRQHHPRRPLLDKGTQFMSDILQQGMLRLKVIPTTASLRHPQVNPVERWMRTLETTLRTYYNQQKWRDYLPLIEVIINHMVHVSTSVTPFEALTGQHSELLDIYLPYLPDMCEESVPREEVQQEIQKSVKAHLFSAARKHKEKLKSSKLSKFKGNSSIGKDQSHWSILGLSH
ncbi:hypothetical protein PR048_022574 [Dryococelus australis]|uniref:Integrase catalytic domain-containing protein n=1 Tax=Dryococelus australis TaxID=614101 RepID=A0ABQ9H1H2_9NEOP|nr:hypothetical protein PR048_022574 [Dryococelus australis]